MVDYMIWPWAERADVLALVFNEKLFPDEEFSKLRAWCRAMRTQDGAVKETQIPPKRHYNVVKAYKEGGIVDYDSI